MQPIDNRVVTFVLESSRETISRAADMLSSVIEEFGLSDDAAFDIELAAEEAVANAVEHGNKSDPAKMVHVRCERKSDRITVVVCDEGEGFNPSQIPDPTLPENILKEHGRGIFIMRSLCDCVLYNEKGNEVAIVKKIPAPVR